jgi:hypothetical protein
LEDKGTKISPPVEIKSVAMEIFGGLAKYLREKLRLNQVEYLRSFSGINSTLLT